MNYFFYSCDLRSISKRIQLKNIRGRWLVKCAFPVRNVELQTCRNWRNSGNFYLLLNYKIIFKAAHSMHTFVHISSNCIEWLHALFLPKKKPQSKIKCDIFVCFHTNHDSFLCLRVCFYKCTSTFTECA